MFWKTSGRSVLPPFKRGTVDRLAIVPDRPYRFYRWLAPEPADPPSSFSASTDIWQFGCLTYEIFANGADPWPGRPIEEQRGRAPVLPDLTPSSIVDLAENAVSRLFVVQISEF
ncbi:hypothetical protein PRIPAC_89202 [Pristionchus pacificus]|uniref:Tyrosine kinase n=1 Tax=Pristionchus pacificus TaxID=54126 RepID=A0A8R1YAJ6_PRIPA|nr:hypothetical protein PRIPAC_89202 [Pristionchus pacificus]|eukprot:PDM81498.1 Tyrosine kinase [Pristionchus pacificus]